MTHNRGVGGSTEVVAPVAAPWWSAYVRVGGVAIAHADLRPDQSREAEALARMDPEERRQWLKYLPGPRRRFTLCRAALRAILCGRLDCRNEHLSFGNSKYGKPFAMVGGVKSQLSFNVSHSGNHGLIAVAPRGRLGIDLEERVPKRNLDGLVEAVMGPDEQAELASLRGLDRLRLFYRLWTFKEAVIKALGTGFSTDISRFQVPHNLRRGDKTGSFRFPHLPSVAWGLEDIGNEEFAAALAYELPPSPSEPFDSQLEFGKTSPGKA